MDYHAFFFCVWQSTRAKNIAISMETASAREKLEKIQRKGKK